MSFYSAFASFITTSTRHQHYQTRLYSRRQLQSLLQPAEHALYNKEVDHIMDHSPLGRLRRLPPELRVMIWELLFCSQTYFCMPHGSTEITPLDPGLLNRTLAITRVCRQARGETLPILFTDHRFTLGVNLLDLLGAPYSDWAYAPQTAYSRARQVEHALLQWPGRLGADSLRSLRHVCLDLGRFDTLWSIDDMSHLTRAWDRIRQVLETVGLTNHPGCRVSFVLRYRVSFGHQQEHFQHVDARYEIAGGDAETARESFISESLVVIERVRGLRYASAGQEGILGVAFAASSLEFATRLANVMFPHQLKDGNTANLEV